MKFKIGDKVRIVKNTGLEVHNIYVGKIGIIKELHEGLDYPYVLDTETLIFDTIIESYWQDEELELVDELKDGNIVYVSNNSEEDALENKDERVYIFTYPKGKDLKYGCIMPERVDDYKKGKDYNMYNYRYAVRKPLEEKKERKIECTDEKWSQIEEILKLK